MARSKKRRVETNLTPDDTEFVGRRAELQDLELLLADPSMVTLVGPPGTGKTRLSRELARRSVDRGDLGGGVFFCDLSDARDLDGLCAVVASVFGVRLSVLDPSVPAGNELVEQLGYAIGSHGDTLVVLDNFEQVLAAAPAVHELRALAPLARLLVTSREPLRLAGEHAIDLEPLGCPEPHASVEEIAESDAVKLLLSRAALTLDEQSAHLAAELVRELDGIPLAIELAAARLRVLGLEDLLSRMHRRLDLLNRGPRGARERQATLRGALDWSWDLLDEDERRAIAQASVFSGGFGADAAEAVLDTGGPTDPIDLLTTLTEKSLVRRVQDDAGRARYTLFESVRSWAAEKLAGLGEADEARDRHAHFFGATAPTSDFDWLSRERPNLLAAIERLTRTDQLEQRVHLLLAVEPVLVVSGPHDQHGRLLDAAVGSDLSPLEPELRARLLAAQGRALRRRTRLDDAAAALDAARSAAGELDDPALSADVLAERGQLEQTRGRLDDAQACFEEARLLLGKRDDPGVRCRVLRGLGLLHHGRGALDDARLAYDEALSLARRSDDRGAEAGLLVQIASVRLQQKRLDEAFERYNEARMLAEALADPITVGLVEGNLGILEQERGRLEEAAEHFEAGLVSLRRGGARLYEAHLLGYLGALLHEKRELAGAIDRYRDAIAILAAVGDRRLEGVFRSALAAAEAGRDRIDAAAEQLAAATNALEGVGDPGLTLALELHGAQLQLCRARIAERSGEQGRAAELRASVDSVVAAAMTTEALQSSDDARLALRLLNAARTQGALVVGTGCLWLGLPDGSRIDFSQRASLRHLIAALVQARRDEEPAALSSDDLLEAGWPGEKVGFDAGRNRVKVALSTLRKLGLRDLLIRHDDGYLLDPRVVVMEEDKESE